ncbi:glycosyltransferase [Ascidiaceihabitans sp.]|uniref:glycosyltransferase family protein n=1 Tax=Ascidiaceihabitans sp. TaxID=1872644 RepID=UPI00329812FF
MKLMIIVTHLLGSGHLSRALTLGRCFAQKGHAVRILSGGMPAPHLDTTGVQFLQMPPLRSDGTNFTDLLDDRGTAANPNYMSSRRDMLVDALRTDPPDVIITELFPFGRRSLKDEFQHLLDAAHSLSPKPLVFASIRDILAPPSKPRKAEFAAEVLDRFYDGVLVHSDPEITPLGISWPVTDALEQRLSYTGFVAPTPPNDHPDALGQGEILVSAGGGSVGDGIFETCIKAAILRPDLKWRILLGGSDADVRIKAFKATAPANVILNAARPDFRQMLRHATASVSMCGYNTALDVLQTQVPAVFIPFDAGGEVEQTLRAKALAALPGIQVVLSDALTPNALIAALDSVSKDHTIETPRFGFDGARRTVQIVEQKLAAR